MSPRVLPRPLLLVVAALVTVLAVGGAPVTAGAVEGAAPTVTALGVTPASPTIGETITLRAEVSYAGGAVPRGEVFFSAAAAEEDLWGDTGWGPVTLRPDGVATYEVTVDTDTLPFVAAGQAFYVAASYSPFDEHGMYDDEFQSSIGEPVRVEGPEAAAVTDTTTTVTGPTTAYAGVGTTLTASVVPEGATGTVQFSVGGSPVGSPVAVTGGTASTPHTFATAGTASVTAAFTPTDPAYSPSADTVGRAVTVRTRTVPSFAFGTQKGIQSSSNGTSTEYVTAGVSTTLYVSVSGISDSGPAGTATFALDGGPAAAWTEWSGRFRWYHDIAFTPGHHTIAMSYAGPDASVAPVETTFDVYAAAPTGVTVSAAGVGSVAAGKVRLTATVTSGDGAPRGAVQWSVAGGVVGTATVVDGQATIEVTRAELTGRPTAKFVPADSRLQQPSTSAAYDLSTVTWPGATSLISTSGIGPIAPPIVFEMPSFSLCAPTPIRVGIPSDGDLISGEHARRANEINASSAVLPMVRLEFEPSPFCGPPAWRLAAAERTSAWVPCQRDGRGYSCPLGVVPAGSAVTVTVRHPLPATAAGKKVTLRGTAYAVDPETGAETALATGSKTVRVPRRTLLAASLAPAGKIAAAKRGARVGYRVQLRNAGVLAARDVKVCVSVGAGAQVRTARGAKVDGRKACWTVPRLAKGKAAKRALVIGTPRRKGPLKVTLAVTPRKTQASPVRLAVVLPVR